VLEASEFVADVVVTLLPLLLLNFAGITASLDGKSAQDYINLKWVEKQWGEQVRRAANLGPTVFPIAFAVIVRRMLREGAWWRAQCGAPLGALDELLGSTSLFGTVETQFLLRSCSVTGVLLFVLWALSPIGVQASLRLVTMRNNSQLREEDTMNIAKEQAYSSAFVGPSAWSRDRHHARALLDGSLSATGRAVDLWQNVKLPFLEVIRNYVEDSVDESHWVKVAVFGADYSSLIGVPFMAESNERYLSLAGHFTIEAQYFMLYCPVLRNISCGADIHGAAYQTNAANWGIENRLATNSTSRYGRAPFILATKTQWYGRHEFNESLLARDIIWQSNGIQDCTQALCSLALSHVEANVTCIFISLEFGSCKVTNIRRSQRPHPSNNFTPFDNADTTKNFFDKWPEMLSAVLSDDIPSIDLYSWKVKPDRIDLDDPPRFSRWLTILWNTAWQAGIAPQYVIRGLRWINKSTRADIAAGKVVKGPNGPLLMNLTKGTATYDTGKHYVCEKHWLALLMAASFALLLSGIAGFWAKYTTIAPDILTHASSLTRDNPYIPLPPGGNTLDGVERARALKHVRVRLCDVQPGAPVGHIALALDDDDDDTPAAGGTTDAAAAAAAAAAATTTSSDRPGGRRRRRRRGFFSGSQRGAGYLQKRRLYA
jgi:hypothetical protein